MSEPLYTMRLTEGEIIIIREAVRRFPSCDMSTLYAPELMSLDRKTTDQLADIFDQKNLGAN